MFGNFFLISCCLWDNVERYCRAGQTTQMTIIRFMRTACWLHKATHVHSEYVILIALPLQQWLHELATVLHYKYISFLV